MRYMQSFNRRLRQLRETRQLSRSDLAELCGVEDAQVAAWESADPRARRYPSVAELMDICLLTDSSLDTLLDFDEATDAGQLELPGLAFGNDGDLGESLKQLEKEINRLQLSDEERELLRRFRKTSAENRRMVLQLLGR